MLLVEAVLSGVAGSTALKVAAAGGGRVWPLAGVVAGYGVATVVLALLMERLPVGIIYAVWGGGAAVCLTVVGRLVFGEVLTRARVLGVALIVGGVVLLNLSGSL